MRRSRQGRSHRSNDVLCARSYGQGTRLSRVVSQTFIEMANQEAVHAGFYATLNGKYNADIWKVAENFAVGEEKGEEQVNQFAQAFRTAGMNEAADEMEIFAKQEGHHGATLRAMIEKYKK